jgi:enoyl-CoA hydratase/carnithine racemase
MGGDLVAVQRVSEFLSVERGLGPDGRIAVVRFDRGDGVNALSPEAMRQLTSVARGFEDDADTSAVVLTGSAKAFSAGFDLKDPEGRSRKDMDLGSLRRSLKVGPRLTRAWQEVEQVTISQSKALPSAAVSRLRSHSIFASWLAMRICASRKSRLA